MSKTEKNLQDAFAGECQAFRKYMMYAAQADKEGQGQVARLFRAAAEAEAIHAATHFKSLGKVKSTAENLKDALGGETWEFETMYPPMLEAAREEGDKTAERAFRYANEAEKVHASLYKKALENLGANEEVDYWVCAVCGHIEEREAPEKCPICGAAKKGFFKAG